MRPFGKPMLPRGLLRELIELKAPTPVYDPDNGGQWVSSQAEEVPFQGCVLMVSEEDWQKAAQGTYTKDSRKIYTNGHALSIGGQVYDPQDGAIYTVTGELSYGSIHPFHRFVAERKGVAKPK